MKVHVVSFIAGLIFSIGLVISGMTNPDVVIGFLDITGEWNYSLAFVMAGAVTLNFFSFKYILKRKPILSPEHLLPTKKDLDVRLILGATLFGIGWGLLGICPGPGIVNLSLGTQEILLFMLALIFGLFIHDFLLRKRDD